MRQLGNQGTSEELIRELYIGLRHKVNEWAAVTHQTAQARMGYVGQHLVSVVTGYRGSKTGARGHDLIVDAERGEYAEIKTCYRIDQLGICKDCSHRVAAIEAKCAVCGSENIDRKVDSKWLLTIKNARELKEALEPVVYFLVLFEQVDDPELGTIQASIWSVNPQKPGFALCVLDYYLNIRAHSQSKASFNWWPYSPKFYLMNPKRIYRSLILPDDQIITKQFDDVHGGTPEHPRTWAALSTSRNLTLACLQNAGKALDVDEGDSSKKAILGAIDASGLPPEKVADQLAVEMYIPRIKTTIKHGIDDEDLDDLAREILLRYQAQCW